MSAFADLLDPESVGRGDDYLVSTFPRNGVISVAVSNATVSNASAIIKIAAIKNAGIHHARSKPERPDLLIRLFVFNTGHFHSRLLPHVNFADGAGDLDKSDVVCGIRPFEPRCSRNGQRPFDLHARLLPMPVGNLLHNAMAQGRVVASPDSVGGSFDIDSGHGLQKIVVIWRDITGLAQIAFVNKAR